MSTLKVTPATRAFDALIDCMKDEGFPAAEGAEDRYRDRTIAAIDKAMQRGWKPLELTGGLTTEHGNFKSDLHALVVGEEMDLDPPLRKYKLQALSRMINIMFDPPATKAQQKEWADQLARQQNPVLMAVIALNLRKQGYKAGVLESEDGTIRVVVKRSNLGGTYSKKGAKPTNFLVHFCSELRKIGCRFTEFPSQSVYFGHFTDGYGHKLHVGLYWNNTLNMSDLLISVR